MPKYMKNNESRSSTVLIYCLHPISVSLKMHLILFINSRKMKENQNESNIVLLFPSRICYFVLLCCIQDKITIH